MKIPLIKIQQKKESFYISKMKVKDLKKYIVLNFRYPYIDSLNEMDELKFETYLEQLGQLKVEYRYGTNNIQRAINLDKMKKLSNYIKGDNNFLPNALILGCFKRDGDFIEDYSSLVKIENENLDMYSMKLDPTFELTAIDGQHRLAGLIMSDSEIIDELEVPIVLLFGVSLTVSSKIFIDINSNQKSVDKSLMYDLLPVLSEDNDNGKLKQKEINSLKKCHSICVTFYKSKSSPFYKQIRMLGTGTGSISQAFFVDQIYPHIHKGILENLSEQDQFEVLYSYFRMIRKTFQNDWPVLATDPTDLEHTEMVLNHKKSQLPKTLGVGAWLQIFPEIMQYIGFSKVRMEESFRDINNNLDFKIDLLKKIENLLYNLFKGLEGKIVWNESDYINIRDNINEEPIFITGTNKVAINNLAKKIKDILLS
ncbi:hypothetical protein BK049_08635 [Bacillus xiamenensis]|uniref:DGQHR domain-containing protein n=1 Tax=Bacillus xiamenensis TaxID=1178537 RepID=A0AAC9IH51_9BACI|nr:MULTISPECIES: DGQHR domain-containing protein [Bacillus]AOZ88736.1 hypothetical protein BK049_08635 [Bacillus xiamenensis]MBS4749335.1 DGQHR domain-containing protein [Bacillus altitudinis]